MRCARRRVTNESTETRARHNLTPFVRFVDMAPGKGAASKERARTALESASASPGAGFAGYVHEERRTTAWINQSINPESLFHFRRALTTRTTTDDHTANDHRARTPIGLDLVDTRAGYRFAMRRRAGARTPVARWTKTSRERFDTFRKSHRRRRKRKRWRT